MRRVLAATAFTILLATLALEAEPPRLYTHPQIPSQQELTRLGLKKRWHVYAPMDGRRDGIHSVQALGHQLVIQSTSGRLMAFDAETGAMQWHIQVGEPYRSHKQAVAANAATLFAAIDTKLYGIDRLTGHTDWTLELPGVLSAAPAVDAERMFLCTGRGGLFGFVLPPPSLGLALAEKAKAESRPPSESAAKPSEDEKNGPADGLPPLREPEMLWSFRSDNLLRQPTAILSEHVVIADSKGRVSVFPKDQRAIVDRFETSAPVSAPIAQAGESLYIPSEDHYVYAFDLEQLQLGEAYLHLRWRFTGGGKVVRKPVVIGDELYVSSFGAGLFCVNRETGQALWRQPAAKDFIAASRRLVLAGDSQGPTLILDRQKGQIIATLAAQDFAFKVLNEHTDRIFLANHDGLVVCLQDRDKAHDQAVYHNVSVKKPAEPPQEGAEKAPNEKPAEEKKEK